MASLRNDYLPFAVDPDPLPIHSVIFSPTLCSFQGFDSKEIGIPVLFPPAQQIKSTGWRGPSRDCLSGGQGTLLP